MIFHYIQVWKQEQTFPGGDLRSNIGIIAPPTGRPVVIWDKTGICRDRVTRVLGNYSLEFF